MKVPWGHSLYWFKHFLHFNMLCVCVCECVFMRLQECLYDHASPDQTFHSLLLTLQDEAPFHPKVWHVQTFLLSLIHPKELTILVKTKIQSIQNWSRYYLTCEHTAVSEDIHWLDLLWKTQQGPRLQFQYKPEAFSWFKESGSKELLWVNCSLPAFLLI